MLINLRTFLLDPSPYYFIRFRTLLADPLPSISAYVLNGRYLMIFTTVGEKLSKFYSLYLTLENFNKIKILSNNLISQKFIDIELNHILRDIKKLLIYR
jgi:hypothetical protein